MRGAHVQAHLKPFTLARRQRRGAAAPATSRYGGGGGGSFGGGYGGASDPRLIIPGQDRGGNRPGGRLVVPGQGGTPPARGGGSLLDAPPAMQQQFRPPPGFMNAEGPAEGPEQRMSPEEMLGRLRSLAGHWHELARFLPALQRAGYDSVAVEEATGLERRVQNVWNTAAQVYESVKGVLPPDQLAHFDVEGEVLLYELRFLSVRQRAPAAAYIVENNLRWAGGGVGRAGSALCPVAASCAAAGGAAGHACRVMAPSAAQRS